MGDDLYINHILESISKIDFYIAGMTKKDFIDDERTQDAVIRKLEIIGEATKRVSEEIKDELPLIPWTDMAGMRDVLIHHYLEVDLDIVWKTITEDIPVVNTALKELSQ